MFQTDPWSRRPASLAAAALLLAALLAGGQTLARSPPPTDCAAGTPVALRDAGCATLDPPRISCRQPADVQGALAQPNLNVRQRAANLYGWQQFIALNWPALAGHPGLPDPARGPGDDGPRVWETWRDVGTVYLPDGADPGPWGQTMPLPAACADADRVLYRNAKVDDLLDAMVQPTGAEATRPPILTDQAGQSAWFDIRMNRVAYDHVRAQRLYNGAVQQQADSVVFPDGAMLVKGAWRVLSEGDEGRYLSAQACVCGQVRDGVPGDCAVRTVGLVGLHLMAKTPSAPQWLWATYEQLDNVPPGDGTPLSFHAADCDAAQCPPNQVQPIGVPTQVTRLIPIPDRKPDCARPDQAVDDLKTLNEDLAAALRDVAPRLAHYQLVGLQWPVHAGAPAAAPTTVFAVLPELLGNTTLETFIQETSSCMGCHAMARSNRADRFVSADFTFTLNDARPLALAPQDQPAPPDAASLLGLDAATQALVQRGFQLATATHELRPDVAPARLHCGSCHLDAGRDPAASWWVGMTTWYPLDAPSGVLSLAGRINSCFEHSMNGRALCVPGSGEGGCATDPDMQALIAYMGWIDRRYRAGGTPPRGFPALADGDGDADHGRALFTQKCAFCHGDQGQGRYAGGVYFRPALWGPDSYNASAGMGSVGMLARFIHANMPLGSAGVLTVQEAWDLAAFIDGQCRPGKDCAASAAGR